MYYLSEESINERMERILLEMNEQSSSGEHELDDLDIEIKDEIKHVKNALIDLDYDQVETKNYLKYLIAKRAEIFKIQEENGFVNVDAFGGYDEDAELDRMFPNRHDDDFDEDEISGESFYRED